MMLQPQGVELQTSTEALRQTARQARVLYNRLLKHMNIIEGCLNASPHNWDTEGAQLLYSYFKEDQAEYDSVKKTLVRQIEHLEQIAEIYKQGEHGATEDSATLPDTILR